MTKKFLLSVLILFFINPILSQNSKSELDNYELKQLQESLKNTQEDISGLNKEIAVLRESISNLEKQNVAQIEFYRDSQTLITSIIAAAFALIIAAFGVFAFLYNKPKQIWKRYKDTKNKAKSILERLEFQYRHQETLFIIGKKALFEYTPNDWEMIEHYSENAILTKPNKRTANDWVYIGLSNFKNQDIPSAILALKTATEIDKNFEVAFKHLGTIYDVNQEHQKAINAFERIIEINPRNDLAYNNAAIAYSQLGMHNKSIDYYKKGIYANPENRFIYTNHFEENLINDEEFDQELVKQFKTKFSDDKDAMSHFKMYEIYKKVLSNEEIDLNYELEKWLRIYGKIFPVESFYGVENWVSKKQGQLKTKLENALNFFKNTKEKTAPNN